MNAANAIPHEERVLPTVLKKCMKRLHKRLNGMQFEKFTIPSTDHNHMPPYTCFDQRVDSPQQRRGTNFTFFVTRAILDKIGDRLDVKLERYEHMTLYDWLMHDPTTQSRRNVDHIIYLLNTFVVEDDQDIEAQKARYEDFFDYVRDNL